MHIIDVMRIAIRMLRTNLLRSLLTVLGISIAISFIVMLIGFGYGLQSLTIGSIVRSKTLLSLDVRLDGQQGGVLTSADAQKVGKLPDVASFSPVIVTAGQLSIDGQVAAVAVNSGTAEYPEMEGVEMQSGRIYKDGAPEIVISPQTLELLSLRAEDVTGKTVKLSYTDPNNENDLRSLDNLLIVGVTSTTDSPALFMPISQIDPTGTTKLTMVKAVARNREGVIGIRNQLTSQGYLVESLIDTLDQARRVFRWVTIGLAVFGMIALVVASVGMFNTLTIALIERTREIGIMKSIGVTDKDVRSLFLAEAAIIGLMGGLFGISVGVVVSWILEAVLNQYARVYDASALQLFQYPTGFFLAVILFPITLSMLTGLYPANRAAKLNPLNALRYE